MAGVFEQHDRQKFETFAFSYGVDDKSQMRARIMQSFEHVLEVRDRTQAEIASLIRENEIDIVVDLMWYTKEARLGILAMRPAPIQVNYLGFPGTSGAPWLDYLIADRYLVPEGSEDLYSEKIAYLPDTFQANDSKRPRPSNAPSRVELGLPQRGIVFCCFNSFYKLTPAVFDVWMRLLNAVSDSVLWIIAPNAVAEKNLRREAQARGVDPKRLVLAPPIPHRDYLARFLRADMVLDTLPFNGGTTTSDALWMGLPVVTCSGETFASRMAGSLLQAAGVPELITTSLEEYEALALKLALNPQLLAQFKEKLAPAQSPLFDTVRLTRHFERALETMWKRQMDGDSPASFTVDMIER